MGSGSEQQTQWFRDGTKNVGLVVLKPSLDRLLLRGEADANGNPMRQRGEIEPKF